MDPLAAATLFAAALGAPAAFAQTEIQWWHSMSGQHNEKINEIAKGFNASQSEFRLVPVYKGSYPESMTAAIAAFRAGNAPHIVQVFEVGTATMMAAKGAIKPVTQVMNDAGEPFNPKAYLPAVTGYYSDSQGNMLSMPFNSSTAIFYINKDAFKKAGLDPNKAPKTWKEFTRAAEESRFALLQHARTMACRSSGGGVLERIAARVFDLLQLQLAGRPERRALAAQAEQFFQHEKCPQRNDQAQNEKAGSCGFRPMPLFAVILPELGRSSAVTFFYWVV